MSLSGDTDSTSIQRGFVASEMPRLGSMDNSPLVSLAPTTSMARRA